MQSYIHSLNQRQNNELNAALKGLHNQIDGYIQPEETQEYTDICDRELKFPRDLGRTIPIIGTAGGCLMILGSTDGKSLSIKEPPEYTTETFTETVLEEGKNEEFIYGDEKMTISYADKGDVFLKTTTITRKNRPLSVAMRF